MAKKTAPLLPVSEDRLVRFGERLRLARLRRRLTAKQVAERAGMTPVTLRNLERGGSGVTIGAYLSVMQVLGIERDLDLVAKDDTQGRELQDARLPRRTATTGLVEASALAGAKPALRKKTGAPQQKQTETWFEDSGFVSANTLAELITPPPAPSSRKRKR
jgi:transcriptional regulator with XRE-family HTH domain